MLSMVFPDVRLKNYIEIRMADSLPKEEAFAYVSLIRDIFYGGNITKIRRYLGNPTEEDIAQAKENVISYGEDGIWKKGRRDLCLPTAVFPRTNAEIIRKKKASE